MPGKNTGYSNFFLANEVEDQFNSHLDLQQFCTVDRTLVGTAGMTKKVNVYKATDGTEKLEIGAGNTKSITVSFSEQEYKILLAQNRFEYYDEEAMEDPMVVPVGMRHAGTDMFNTVNKDIFDEFGKTEQTLEATDYGFGTFADAVAMLNIEGTDDDPKVVAPRTFAFLNPKDMAAVRKALKDELKYVEAFARAGYVGSVAGVNLFTKKDATAGEIILATKQAVTLFVKKGVEVERYTPGNRGPENGNTRLNTIFTRKYYLAALTDKTKAVKITVSGGGMTSSTVKVPTALSNGYGKTVDELVEGAEIRADGSVYGTLLSVTGYTGFSDNPTEQKGHYFPIVLDDKYKGKTISCQRNSDAPKQSSDLEWVLRVVSNSTKFTFRADDEEILTLNFENATLA